LKRFHRWWINIWPVPRVPGSHTVLTVEFTELWLDCTTPHQSDNQSSSKSNTPISGREG
jgi:hypothetical protein